MRTLGKMMRAILAAMAAATRVVWEGGKAVLRSVIPSMPMPVADEVEEAMERVAATRPADGGAPLPLVSVDVGQRVFDFALSKASGGRHPAPSMAEVPEDIVRWAASLSDAELRRLTQHGPRRVGEHVLGVKAIANLPLCREARVAPGFAKIGNRIQYIGEIKKADMGPALTHEETPQERTLAILEDLIDDQPETTTLRAA
ncbi:hypothetical protein [Methylobacterium brachiatum]|jgi:hypothetical protein|uniref:hypothetical protein n=1 Tax=Methylobacterium brachiatum TaxID=269660 RepID=UPI002447CBB1|nr:hypothetical protein [Methylobacterium brachiatum]MDH2309470.1 hypothetical protein [Methylobacterium brachiatum]